MDAEQPEQGDPLSVGALLGLWLPPASIADGRVTGGVIRQAHSILLHADYRQAVTPVDEALHPGIRVNWHAVLEDNGVGLGPLYGVGGDGWFGPPGVYDLRGLVEIGADQTAFSFTPIAYANVLRVCNASAADRVITPAWRFMEASILFADSATVTLQANDINRGGAAFVDSQFLATANGGRLDGTTHDIGVTSLLSAPVVLGHTHLAFRHAVDVFDTNTYLGHDGSSAFEAFLDAQGLVPGADLAGGGVIDRQVGIRIRHLTSAAVNVGIENESATVEALLPVRLESASAVIPLGATAVALTNESGQPLTLPTSSLEPGQDGQRITLVNVGDDDIVLDLGAGGATLRRGDAAVLVYAASLGSWVDLTNRSSEDRAPTLLRRGGHFSFPTAGARTTVELEPNRLHAVPIFLGRAIVVDRLAFEVTGPRGEAGVCRLGLYDTDPVDDVPGRLLFQSEPIDVHGDRTGPGVAPDVGTSLGPGLYWLAIAAENGAPHIRAFTGGQPVADAGFGDAVANCYVRTLDDGTWPTRFGTPSDVADVAPLIGLCPR